MIQFEENLRTEKANFSDNRVQNSHATCYMLGFLIQQFRECLPGLQCRRGTHLVTEIATTFIIVSWIRPTGFVLLCAPLNSLSYLSSCSPAPHFQCRHRVWRKEPAASPAGLLSSTQSHKNTRPFHIKVIWSSRPDANATLFIQPALLK